MREGEEFLKDMLEKCAQGIYRAAAAIEKKEFGEADLDFREFTTQVQVLGVPYVYLVNDILRPLSVLQKSLGFFQKGNEDPSCYPDLFEDWKRELAPYSDKSYYPANAVNETEEFLRGYVKKADD